MRMVSFKKAVSVSGFQMFSMYFRDTQETILPLPSLLTADTVKPHGHWQRRQEKAKLLLFVIHFKDFRSRNVLDRNLCFIFIIILS